MMLHLLFFCKEMCLDPHDSLLAASCIIMYRLHKGVLPKGDVKNITYDTSKYTYVAPEFAGMHETLNASGQT